MGGLAAVALWRRRAGPGRMGWPMLPLLALAAERGASPAPEPWDPPALVTVGGNATTTERYAAASLADRLRTTLGLAAARVETAGAATRGQPQLAVGFDAARLAAPGGAGQLHGLGDDGYVLLPLPQGGVLLEELSEASMGHAQARVPPGGGGRRRRRRGRKWCWW